MKKQNALFRHGCIWFGAAVSTAEILTGTLFAPLGFQKGLYAIALGHGVGCVLLYLVGLIGAQTKKSSMETAGISFGKKGAIILSCFNILQLVGWTAVMIVNGAAASFAVTSFGNFAFWCVAIGVLIAVWLWMDMKNWNRINILGAGTLFFLTLLLARVVFRTQQQVTPFGSISFGGAVELSIAMPLSWMPLISDYTKEAENPKLVSAVSSVTYFISSSWMYLIGLGAALFTGESDIAHILMQAGFGAASLVILILSTVTTTFLDVYSAGVSSESVHKKCHAKPFALGVCVIGTLLAIFTPIVHFEDFLYFIGSVFVPMITILLADYFLWKQDASKKQWERWNLLIWMAGFLCYRFFLQRDTPFGSTLPAMICTFAVGYVVNFAKNQWNVHNKKNIKNKKEKMICGKNC